MNTIPSRRVFLKMIQLAVGLTLGCLGIASAQRPPMPPCVALEHSSGEPLLEYLSGDRAVLSSDCVEVALRRLGVNGSVPASSVPVAIDILVRFLDFRSEGAASVGVLLPPPEWTRFYLYPARTALVGIGPRAVDRLISAIADATASDIVVENATYAIDSIYNVADGPSGSLRAVVALSGAASATSNASSASRLRAEARKLAGKCAGSELQSRCEAALN